MTPEQREGIEVILVAIGAGIVLLLALMTLVAIGVMEEPKLGPCRHAESLQRIPCPVTGDKNE